MNQQEIEKRLDELTALASERMDNAKHLPNLCYAGIFWLNDAELEEHNKLVQELCRLTQDSSENARLRIKEKIAKRKLALSVEGVVN